MPQQRAGRSGKQEREAECRGRDLQREILFGDHWKGKQSVPGEARGERKRPTAKGFAARERERENITNRG